MKKLLIFLFFVLLSGSASAQVCFDKVSDLPSGVDYSGNYQLARGATGTFYAVSQIQSKIATSADGVSWTQKTVPLQPRVFEADPATGQFLLAASSSATQVSVNDGTSWTSNPVTGIYAAANGDSIYVASNQYNNVRKLYKLLPDKTLAQVGPNLAVHFYNYLSVSGNNAYLGSDDGVIVHVNLASPDSGQQVDSITELSALYAADDGAVYSGTSSGAVFIRPPSQTTQSIGSTGLKVRSITKYNGKVIIVSSDDFGSNAKFAVYNGTLQFFDLNSSVSSSFISNRAVVRSGKLYLLGKDTVSYGWSLYRFKDECLQPVQPPAASNQPPVLRQIPNATVLVNTTLRFDLTATDPENAVLQYEWDQVSGPAIPDDWVVNAPPGETWFNITFNEVGNYTINATVRDNATPPLNHSVFFTIFVTNATSVTNDTDINATNAATIECNVDADCGDVGVSCVSNECISTPLPSRATCSSSEACADNEECVAGACTTLSCGAGEIALDHACIPLSQLPVCNGVPHTDQGVCCNNEWLPGQTQCPASASATNQSRNVTVRGGPTGGDIFSAVSQQIATIGLAVVGMGVLGLLVIAGLVYWFFLRKKPPV